MKTLFFCLAALAASAPSFTQTAIPDVPTLTAGAEFKGLRFDWEPVARASWYQLELRAHQTGPFVQEGDDFPASVTATAFSFPLHLFDWTYARYRLAACNSVGCSRSAAISVSALRRLAVGNLKPTPYLRDISFGEDTDLSSDGYHLVSAAPRDFIYSGGNAHYGGSLFVFARGSDRVWRQRARLVPTIPPFIESTNQMSVAISGNGNTVALGMPNYFHQEFDENAGEVFMFRFNGSSWVRTRVARVPSGVFGAWVALNDAGDTLSVGVRDSATKVAIYKLVSGVWQNVRNIVDAAGHTEFCGSGVLSRDGSTVAESCVESATASAPARDYVRVHSGTNWNTRTDIPLQMSTSSPLGYYGHIGLGIDRTGGTIAAQIFVPDGATASNGPSQVNVFRRSGASYSKVAELTPGAWRAPAQRSFFGFDLAVSGDGSSIAIGDPWDNGLGGGPRAAPLIAGEVRTGAVYVYRLKSTWSLANMVKPNDTTTDSRTFGREVTLSNTGKTLLVGDIGSGSLWMY